MTLPLPPPTPAHCLFPHPPSCYSCPSCPLTDVLMHSPVIRASLKAGWWGAVYEGLPAAPLPSVRGGLPVALSLVHTGLLQHHHCCDSKRLIAHLVTPGSHASPACLLACLLASLCACLPACLPAFQLCGSKPALWAFPLSVCQVHSAQVHVSRPFCHFLVARGLSHGLFCRIRCCCNCKEWMQRGKIWQPSTGRHIPP